MTSNHHASYVLGYKRATMAITKRAEAETRRKPGKDSLSSDCGLKLTHTKMKLLVIPNQNVGVNACHGSWGDPKPVSQPFWRQPSKVKPATGVKS